MCKGEICMSKMPDQQRASIDPMIVQREDAKDPTINKDHMKSKYDLGNNIVVEKEPFFKYVLEFLLKNLALLIIPPVLLFLYMLFIMVRR